jgi:hypothetical protein
MCPLVTSAEIPSMVDASAFLKEILRAHPTLSEHAVPGNDSPAAISEHCHGELARGLSAAWEKNFPGMAHNSPQLGTFAPVDPNTIRSDPSCTAGLFTRILRKWGMDLTATDGVERGILNAASNLTLQPGKVHGLQDRILLPDNHAINWMLRYTPFSVSPNRVGLLFAFTAARNLR